MFILLTTLLLVSYTSQSLGHGFSHDQGEWHNFREEYPKCVFGAYQAPVHIQSHLVEPVVMPALDFRGYHNFLAPPIKLKNDGYTVKFTFGSYQNDGLYFKPRISGGFLLDDYVFHSLHFHWGTNNERGSEHVIEDFRYPMEMHIVHLNSNYSTWDEAQRHKNGFVVLAFLYQVQVKDNHRYDPIIDKLQEITVNGTSTHLDVSLPLVSLLPRHTEFFYMYVGSLTSPPCSESVTWILFPDPILISFRQMQEFRNLKISENFRRLQPLGQRKIYFRVPQRFAKPHFNEYPRRDVSSESFWLRA